MGRGAVQGDKGRGGDGPCTRGRRGCRAELRAKRSVRPAARADGPMGGVRDRPRAYPLTRPPRSPQTNAPAGRPGPAGAFSRTAQLLTCRHKAQGEDFADVDHRRGAAARRRLQSGVRPPRDRPGRRDGLGRVGLELLNRCRLRLPATTVSTCPEPSSWPPQPSSITSRRYCVGSSVIELSGWSETAAEDGFHRDRLRDSHAARLPRGRTATCASRSFPSGKRYHRRRRSLDGAGNRVRCGVARPARDPVAVRCCPLRGWACGSRGGGRLSGAGDSGTAAWSAGRLSGGFGR